MPNRVIRASILESSSLSRVSELAEALFWRLIVSADDFGRYVADPELVAAYVYPRRRSVSPEDVSARLEELATCDEDGRGPVHLYEIAGRRYLWLVRWELYRGNSKRGRTSKYPLPPEIPNGLSPPADARVTAGARSGDESRGVAPSSSGSPAATASTVPEGIGCPTKGEAGYAALRDSVLAWSATEAIHPKAVRAGVGRMLEWARGKGERRPDVEAWAYTARMFVREADEKIPKPVPESPADRERRELWAEVDRRKAAGESHLEAVERATSAREEVPNARRVVT